MLIVRPRRVSLLVEGPLQAAIRLAARMAIEARRMRARLITAG
jgi:hypothetical protein